MIADRRLDLAPTGASPQMPAVAVQHYGLAGVDGQRGG